MRSLSSASCDLATQAITSEYFFKCLIACSDTSSSFLFHSTWAITVFQTWNKDHSKTQECLRTTVKHVFTVTSIRQPTVFKDQYFVILNLHFNRKMTCIKQSPSFKCHFTLSLAYVKLLQMYFILAVCTVLPLLHFFFVVEGFFAHQHIISHTAPKTGKGKLDWL